MKIALDANILVPVAHPTTEEDRILRRSILNLSSRHRLVAPEQVIVESFGVLTRPADMNGKGLSPARAMDVLKQSRGYVTWVTNPLSMFEVWQNLVVNHSVSGRQVHDARLAAFMLAGGADEIATRNFTDFRRYGIPLREVV